MSAPTSRRAVICGAGLSLAAVAASAMAASPVAKVDGISPDLAALIAAANQASIDADVFDQTVANPAKDKAMALIEAIPHSSVNIDDSPYWTTANPGSVRVAERFVDQDPERRLPDSKQLRRLIAQSRLRDREARRIRNATGFSAAVARSNEMSDAICDAEWAVADFPCRTASDLHAKLSFMIARQMDDGIPVLKHLLPDAVRLAAAGGR